MKKNFSARIVPLEEVYRLSHALARRITGTCTRFDIVIAIARGGMLPGRLICDFLNVGRLSSLQIRHYASGAQQLERAEILDPVRADLKEKKVLMIDDVNDSGKTLVAAVEHVQTFGPALLKTAVLHEKENDLFKADFTGEKLKEWKWLVYQWAATEDLIEFLKKDHMLDEGVEAARTHLIEKYGLTVEPGLLRSVLEMRDNYRYETPGF